MTTDARERRRGRVVLLALVALIAGGPAFNAIAGDDQYDLGIEAYVANYSTLQNDTNVQVAIINHDDQPTTHRWYTTGGSEVLRRGTLHIEAGARATLVLPRTLGSTDGWVTFHLGSAGVRLRWPDGTVGE